LQHQSQRRRPPWSGTCVGRAPRASVAMEAAKEVMNMLARFGYERCVDGMRQLVSGHFLAQGATLHAMQLSADVLARARLFAVEAAVAVHLPPLSAEVMALPETDASLQNIEALSIGIKELIANGGDRAEAMRLTEGLAAAFGALGDRAAEAAALTAHACACAGLRDAGRDAARAAARAVRIARGLGDKSALLHALEALISVSFAFRDADEALRAALELADLSKELGNRRAQAQATFFVARASFGPSSPSKATEAAIEAASLFAGLGDVVAQATALSVAYDVEILLGRSASAVHRAREILALVRGNTQAEPLATLMLGSVATSSPDAMAACQQAVKSFQGTDKSREAAALIALANSQLCQDDLANHEQGLQSAKAALAIFQELKSESGEAAALTTVGAAFALLRNAGEAKKAIHAAVDIFRRLGIQVGSQFATAVLQTATAAAKQSVEATVEFDEVSGLATVRIMDGVSRSSLEAVIKALQESKTAKCILLHLEGSSGQGDAEEEGEPEQTGTDVPRSYGVFLMGLRMIALPMISSICGKISGPMWSLVLASDYRVAATSTVFMCPIWGKPECMGALVGHNSATQLCMANGPRDSLVMLENGIVQQLQRGLEETRKVALETAKRVLSTPAMACRKQPMVLNQAIAEYALSAANGKLVVV